MARSRKLIRELFRVVETDKIPSVLQPVQRSKMDGEWERRGEKHLFVLIDLCMKLFIFNIASFRLAKMCQTQANY